MANQYCTIVDSPIGELSIFADDDFVNKITFKKTDASGLTENKVTKLAGLQLAEYFEGKRQSFNLPISQSGTDFQQAVWKELTTIKYGTSISYLQFSTQLNNVLAIRAIAAANGKNDLAIIIPCHRVIGSNGKLVGYAGGLWRKQWLLDHEREISQQGQMTLRF